MKQEVCISKPGHDAGFTLTEMLVVMVILALSATAGLVAVNSRAPISIEQQAKAVASLFRDAATQAQAHRRPINVTIDTREKMLVIITSEHQLNLEPDVSISLETGRSLVVGQTEGSIMFSPDGSSSGGRVILDNGREEVRTIAVHWLTSAVEIK